jgi:beta-barrel assembly-enhancing protease
VLAALSLGQAATYQQQVNFTRAHELEADRLGIRTLADAGYDPEGMAAFFQRLEQQSRLYGAGLPEILRTHPVTTTRIAEARARAAEYGPRDVRDSVEFGLMQSRARVLTASRPSEPLELFTRRLAAGEDSPSLRYGAALALLELGQYDRALQLLEPALASLPRQPNLRLLQARIHLAARDVDAALATLQKTLEHHPRYAPGILAYADALITVGRPAEARQFLLEKEHAVAQHPEAYRLLSLAAREMNNNGERAYQMALFLYRRGNAGGALEQLDAGLRLAELSEQERARMSAFRAEVRDKLPRNYRPPEERR